MIGKDLPALCTDCENEHPPARCHVYHGDDLREQVTELENRLSSMVSARDLTIRDLRAALAACIEVMGKCAPYSWGRALQELREWGDKQEGDRLVALAPAFGDAYCAGKKALK